jgi:hypothetical protein
LAKAPKSFPELATQRLRLRQFEPRFGDIEAMRYWNFPACKTKAETERWARVADTERLELLAHCVALTVDAVQAKARQTDEALTNARCLAN